MFSPTRLTGLVLSNFKSIVALTGGVVLLAFLYCILAKPSFEANALIQVEGSSSSDVQVLLGQAGVNFPDRLSAIAQIELVRSRSVVGDVVERLGLHNEAGPVRWPVLGEAFARHGGALKDKEEPTYRLHWGYAWGDEKIEVKRLTLPSAWASASIMVTALGQGRYSLKVPSMPQEHPGTVGQATFLRTPDGPFLLEISELEGLPGTKYEIQQSSALEVTEELQKSLLVKEVSRGSGIISVALQGNDPRKTTRILTEIVQGYLRQHIARRTEESEKMLQFVDRQLPLIQADLERAEQQLSEFKSKHGTLDFSETGRVLMTQAVNAQLKINEFKQKKIEAAGTLTNQHPQMKLLDDLIREAQQAVNTLESQIKGLPLLEREALTYTRNVKVISELYASMLSSSQQLRVVKESKVGSVRLIDTPSLPEAVVSPNPLVILPLSVLAGFLFSLIYILFRIMFRNGVQSPEEIELALGMTICAHLLQSDTQKLLSRRLNPFKSRLLAQVKPQSPTIEGLRSLLTPLQMLKEAGQTSWIMVAGPTQGVGKSFTAANLAFLIRASGNNRVLLIDADLRLGCQHEIFGLVNDEGFSTALTQNRLAIDLVQRDAASGVDVLVAGPNLTNPGDLLRNPRCQKLLLELESHYDYIVVDTPPVLIAADAESLVSRMSTVLMVVKDKLTTLSEIARSVQRLKQSGCKHVEVIFNNVQFQARLGAMYSNMTNYNQYYYARAASNQKLDPGP